MSSPRDSSALILGIDPGSLITGYAIVQASGAGDAALVEAGALRLKRADDLAARLHALAADMDALLGEHEFTHMAVESVFSHPAHVQSALQLSHARGVVLLAAQNRGLQLIEYAPAEVKKAISGNGRATKAQVQRAVAMQCGLEAPPTPADVADAIAIALTAARRLRAPSSPAPLPCPEAE